MTRFLLLLFLFLSSFVSGQTRLQKAFPHQGVSLQFAGSVGFLSVGYFHRTPKDKLELAAIYGYTPKVFGGPLHSTSLKLSFSPFHLKVGEHFSLEPIQVGAFVAKNFGKNLYLLWPEKYPKHYYWWSNSIREHAFASIQATYHLKDKSIKDISAYFEANTNDLYVYSYFPNTETMSFYDIVFFGVGAKMTFR